MKKNEIMNAAENAIITNADIMANALGRLGYDMAKAQCDNEGNYTATHLVTVDGVEQEECLTVVSNDEKSCIDIMHTLANVHTLAIPMQCATLAKWYELNSWKEQGFKKFSDYAIAFGCKINEVTIRKYTAIGLCFFKPNVEELQFVDDRLKGVSISNLDIIISTFKAYAEAKAIDGVTDYRDYVSAFIDEFCTDTTEAKARLHLKLKDQKALREECKVIAGKQPKAKADKPKAEADTPKAEELSPYEALVLALNNYATWEDAKDATINEKVAGLLALLTN